MAAGVHAIDCRAGPCQRFARNYATRGLASPPTQPSAAPDTCAVVWVHEVPQGVVNHPSINGMQGIRGSNPLSSTRHNASPGHLLRAFCQQIVSRSRCVAAIPLWALPSSGDFGVLRTRHSVRTFLTEVSRPALQGGRALGSP